MPGRRASEPSRWGETTESRLFLPTRAAVERRIAEIAARQQRLITTEQLHHAGLSQNGIQHRARTGRLFRIRRGVYATHPPPYTQQQRWMAAVLAGGLGTLLSDWPAAEHLGIAPPDHAPCPAIHVTAPGDGGRGHGDLVVHRRGPIDPRDRRSKDGIAVTSADLTLVHLAPRTDDIELEQLLVAAESLGLLKRGRLGELVGEREGQPGIGRLQSLLALPPAEAKSRAELYLIPLYRAAGLPRPRFNHPVPVPGRGKPLLVDLAWPEIRLAFELDTQRFHGDWERAEEDRERDQLLALVDWHCQRLFRRQVRERLAEAAERAKKIYEIRARHRGGA